MFKFNRYVQFYLFICLFIFILFFCYLFVNLFLSIYFLRQMPKNKAIGISENPND